MLLATTMGWSQEKEKKFLIKKGTWNVTGQIATNFNKATFSNNSTTDEFRFNIIPSAGYFINDNLSLGLQVGYMYRKVENNVASPSNIREEISHSVSLSPYIKKYLPISKSLAFSLQGSVSYAYGNSKGTSNTGNIPGSYSYSFGAAIRPGISYFVSKSIALEANIGALSYQNTTNHSRGSNNKTSASNFDATVNFSSFIFGASFYF